VEVAAGAEAAREDGALGVGDQGLGVRAAAVDGQEELRRAHAAVGRGGGVMPPLLSAETWSSASGQKNGCGPEGPQPVRKTG
jgi:hypothetical protein